jgi:hypothetical protein
VTPFPRYSVYAGLWRFVEKLLEVITQEISMQARDVITTGELTALIFACLVAVAAAGQTRAGAAVQPRSTAAAKTPPAFRTAHGDPDLQGVWNFATATPMERPGELAGRERLTAQEASEFEHEIRENASADRREDPVRGDGTKTATSAARSTAAQLSPELRFAYNNFWYDANRTKFVETMRTSLVIEPPDGRIPPLTPEAIARQTAAGSRPRGRVDGPEDRGISERCIIGFNSGPPMTPSYYNNNVQIFQGPGYVAILNEMVHNARIVPLDGRPHLAAHIRQITGDSRGQWDGNTLVVETTNFTPKTAFRGSTEKMRLIERFTRVDEDTLLYRFTVDDPATWTRPWAAEFPMRKTTEQIYEYACHEGNYGMLNILSAARAEERAAAEAKK